MDRKIPHRVMRAYAAPNRIGLIPATPEFLRAIREVTAAHGIVLVLDEVITLRVGFHGAQGLLGIRPDLTTLGKIIGGGFPVGAVGGRVDVMSVLDPRGGRPAVPHGGTFNANPVTMAAGLAAMRMLDRDALDYRAARPDAAEGARLSRITRYLLDHGVFLSTTGPGCISTVMADAEIEWFMEVFAAALAAQP